MTTRDRLRYMAAGPATADRLRCVSCAIIDATQRGITAIAAVPLFDTVGAPMGS